ncbi:GntR family transcriptional regulator [Methylobrevis pamukkalensis]|uniref:FCD domain protein n=1 Tax=Methylobrevis pamukkalensis TaxID=1439726 RepID=A0A1E3GZY8_9HYPH|nr:FCD domain-containing protein [Methylobrevis pamukkalensis]ODN69136.1 FCD domain protein [Methylobrevis pamukkalensis]
MFEALGGLELQIGARLAERITDDEIAELVAMHDTLARLHAQEDRTGYFRQNQSIHGFMAETTRNRTLRDSDAALAQRVYRARTMANCGHDRWDESLAEHLDFMASLRVRDREGLARKLKLHNDLTCTAVLGSLSAIRE